MKVLGLTLVFAVWLSAGQPGLRREGEYWVETSEGSEAVGDGGQLRVITLGSVTVRGASAGRISYTITRKVRARTQNQARDLLQEAGVNMVRQGRAMKLVVNDATGPVDLQVSVPRSMRSLVLTTGVGNVDITDIEGAVHAETGGGRIHATRVRSGVELNSAGGSVVIGEVGGPARVNTAGGDITADSIGGEAVLQTAGGNIFVKKALGGVRADTAGGTVNIGEAGGSVIATTQGGQIDIGKAGGTVTARNAGGGPIWVGEAQGVRCENASGAIKVSSSAGPMRITTAAGSVVAQLVGPRLLGDSLIATGAGDITVYIPSNVGVTIRASNDGAPIARAIVSDFDTVRVRGRGAGVLAEGPINGGGPLLRIEVSGGMIRIKKK